MASLKYFFKSIKYQALAVEVSKPSKGKKKAKDLKQQDKKKQERPNAPIVIKGGIQRVHV